MRAPALWGTAPRSRVVLACAALLLAAPVTARAQARPVARAETDNRLARLEPETGRLVAQLLDSARLRRLPTEPLVDKALEGASKRAPGPRIVEAVRRLSSELAESRRLLGPGATDAEVTAGAQALRAKLAPEYLKLLHEKRGRTTLTASLGAYQELVALRVSQDTAAAAVLALHKAGITAEQLAEYQNEVARYIAIGGEPAMVAADATGRLTGDSRSVSENLPQALSAGGYVPNGGTRPKRKP